MQPINENFRSYNIQQIVSDGGLWPIDKDDKNPHFPKDIRDANPFPKDKGDELARAKRVFRTAKKKDVTFGETKKGLMLFE